VVTRYQKRLSGPILDRIDMHVTVQRVEMSQLTDWTPGESSATVRQRVIRARQRQRRRFAEHPSVTTNAEMHTPELREFCPLDPESAALLRTAVDRFGLSARAYHRILRVARTIADLADSEQIEQVHVAEAVQYQPRG
jgi:magnesium chelatase family protein